MTIEEFSNHPDITLEQRQAFLRLVRQSGYKTEDVLERTTPPTKLSPYLGIRDFHGMFVGIEKDGYVHT